MPELQIPKPFQPLWTPARYKMFHGGRGGGKTENIGRALITMSTQRPLRILCCREIQKSIKASVQRVLLDVITEAKLENFFEDTEREIKGYNGTQFLFEGLRYNIDTIRSMKGIDIAWVEEAHSVSEGSWKVLIPTIRAPGSEIWGSWNPKSPKDPVDARFRCEAPPTNAIVREVNYYDNPWFPDVLREEMEYDRRRDYDRYLHIWEGKYETKSEARVFKNWKIEEFETPPDARFFFGADWGYSVDPSVLVRCFIVGRTLFIDYEAWKIGCEIDNLPKLFCTVPESQRWPIIADSARPETISYMKRHGFPKMKSAKKGPGSLEEGLEFMQSYDIEVHPRCRHVADELAMYSYKVDPLTEEVLPVLVDKENHTIDSCRYALENVRRARYGMMEREVLGAA